MTALWLLDIPESEWTRIRTEMHRYATNLARKLGPARPERRWELGDFEWDTANARDEQDWCRPHHNPNRN